jgi:hypothetical protein
LLVFLKNYFALGCRTEGVAFGGSGEEPHIPGAEARTYLRGKDNNPGLKPHASTQGHASSTEPALAAEPLGMTNKSATV